MFSSVKACCKYIGLLRAPVHFGHLIIIYSIERITLHLSHIGTGSLLIRYAWVRCECPILPSSLIEFYSFNI